jgi:hypothetical protein
MTRRPKTRAVVRKPAKRKASAKTQTKHNPLDQFIAAGARSLGLTVDPAWLPAVRAHLKVTLNHGEVVTEFALPDETEPAPAFRA